MNNFKKILMACTGLIMCSIGNINAMTNDILLSESDNIVSEQNNIDVKQEIKKLKSLCRDLNDVLPDIPLEYSEAVQNNIGRLQMEMSLFFKDYCDERSYDDLGKLIKNFLVGSGDLKQREPQNAVWETLEIIFEKMYDKFTKLTEFLHYNDYIPIDIDACNNLYATLSKDAVKYHKLLPEADKLRTIAPRLIEPNPTDNDILDCYDILLKIMKAFRNTKKKGIRASLDDLYPFYNYVTMRQHIIKRT